MHRGHQKAFPPPFYENKNNDSLSSWNDSMGLFGCLYLLGDALWGKLWKNVSVRGNCCQINCTPTGPPSLRAKIITTLINQSHRKHQYCVCLCVPECVWVCVRTCVWCHGKPRERKKKQKHVQARLFVLYDWNVRTAGVKKLLRAHEKILQTSQLFCTILLHTWHTQGQILDWSSISVLNLILALTLKITYSY